jgi:hypothetical protein
MSGATANWVPGRDAVSGCGRGSLVPGSSSSAAGERAAISAALICSVALNSGAVSFTFFGPADPVRNGRAGAVVANALVASREDRVAPVVEVHLLAILSTPAAFGDDGPRRAGRLQPDNQVRQQFGVAALAARPDRPLSRSTASSRADFHTRPRCWTSLTHRTRTRGRIVADGRSGRRNACRPEDAGVVHEPAWGDPDCSDWAREVRYRPEVIERWIALRTTSRPRGTQS